MTSLGSPLAVGDFPTPANDYARYRQGYAPSIVTRISSLVGKPLPSDRCDTLDMTSLLRALIDRGVKIRAVPTAGPWPEVDSEDDLLLYE